MQYNILPLLSLNSLQVVWCIPVVEWQLQIPYPLSTVGTSSLLTTESSGDLDISFVSFVSLISDESSSLFFFRILIDDYNKIRFIIIEAQLWEHWS